MAWGCEAPGYGLWRVIRGLTGTPDLGTVRFVKDLFGDSPG